jgi:hypothetical protein
MADRPTDGATRRETGRQSHGKIDWKAAGRKTAARPTPRPRCAGGLARRRRFIADALQTHCRRIADAFHLPGRWIGPCMCQALLIIWAWALCSCRSSSPGLRVWFTGHAKLAHAQPDSVQVVAESIRRMLHHGLLGA